MNQLSNWTSHHACTSDFCYVVLGIFQYLGDIQGDIRNCEADFKLAFSNFSAAFSQLHVSAVTTVTTVTSPTSPPPSLSST